MQRTASPTHPRNLTHPRRWGHRRVALAVAVVVIIGAVVATSPNRFAPVSVVPQSIATAADHPHADHLHAAHTEHVAPARAINPPSVARWRLTVAQREHIRWAYARFIAAGLEVPNATILFTTNPAICGGYLGRFRAALNLVQICIDDNIGESALRWLLLHELAHAWEHATLDDDHRERFRLSRGAPTWGSGEHEWTDRAVEHAAEVVAWGLFDIRLEVKPIGGDSDAELRDAFVQLTGATPINDGAHPSPDPTTAPAQTTSAAY